MLIPENADEAMDFVAGIAIGQDFAERDWCATWMSSLLAC